MRPPPARLARPALPVLLLLLLLAIASAANTTTTNSTATGTATAAAACGTTIGGPCCPPPAGGPSDSPDGLSLWSCTAHATIPLVCLDESDAGVTACYPVPDASPGAACGRTGQACCPPNYHRHTSAPLPPSCGDGFCEPLAGATPCSTAKALQPCGQCTANPAGCGAAAGAPCCQFSINGPSDTWTCGSQRPADLASPGGLVPGAGGLTCDYVTRTCVKAP